MITMVVREAVYRSQEYLPPFFCVIIVNKQVKDPICEFFRRYYIHSIFKVYQLVALTLKGTT
jgi:hypothetical protein